MVETEDHSQQDRTVEQLKTTGWIVLKSDEPPQDGSILMQLTTPEGVSHIIVMLNGDRVDARQKLGKNPSIPTSGAP
jgi:hypothetical protein